MIYFYSLILLSIILEVVLSEPQQALTKYSLKMLDDETFEIDYSKFSSKIKQMKIVHSKPENVTNRGEVDKAIGRNYYFKGFIEYADLNKDCIAWNEIDGTDYIFDNTVPIQTNTLLPIQGNKMTLSRNVKVKGDNSYITSSYSFWRWQDKNINRLETVVLKYTNGKLSFSYAADPIDNTWYDLVQFYHPFSPQQNAVYFNITIDTLCINHHYIEEFKETFALCLNFIYTRVEVNGTMRVASWKAELFFNITGRSQSKLLTSYEQGKVPNYSSFQMVLQATQDRSFEVFVYIEQNPDLFYLIVTQNEIMNFQYHRFWWGINHLSYVASTLLLIGSQEEMNSDSKDDMFRNTDRLYYMARYPGTKLILSMLELFSESIFLRASFSRENIEIILQTYRIAPLLVAQFMYSYNLISKKISQISTQVIFISPRYYSNSKRVDSFSLLDNIITMISTHEYNYESLRQISVSLFSIQDVESSFGSVLQANNTYNLYPTHVVYDVKNNTYIMRPYNQTQKVNNITKKCGLITQSISRQMLVIHNVLPDANYPTMIPNLKLAIVDLFLNKPIIEYDVKFINSTEFEQTKYRIWQGSAVTKFEINSSSKKISIPVEILVGGGFVIRRLAEERKNLSLISMSIPDITNVTRGSFLEIINSRYEGVNDPFLNDIEYIFGFEKTMDKRSVQTVVFMKPRDYPGCMISVLKDGKLSEISPISLNEVIKKVIPVQENLYLVFLDDGSLSLYNAETHSLEPRPFPGVNCFDVEQIYHPHLKPSLVCLNFNLQFQVYYIDEIIENSLSNSMFRAQFIGKESPGETDSELLTTEYYAGKVFVYTPGKGNNKPSLSVYYLEVDEFPIIYRINEFNLTSNQADGNGNSYMVRSIAFADQRLVVVYSDTNLKDKNWIVVYEFVEKEAMRIVEKKRYAIPEDFFLTAKSKLMKIYSHFQSITYRSQFKPLMGLYFQLSPTVHNVMLIDPYSTVIETIPSVLLPRSSIAPYMVVFPVYLANANRLRKWSIGLLHYSGITGYVMRDEMETSYLFQFVIASELKVFLLIENKASNSISLNGIFSKFEQLVQFEENLEFESFLYIGDENYRLEKKIIVKQNRTKIEDSDAILKEKVIDLAYFSQKRDELKIDIKNPEILLHKQNFSTYITSPALSWDLETDSIYDELFETFKIVKPVEYVKEIRFKNVQNSREMMQFCRSFKFNPSISPEEKCLKYGWVIFYSGELELIFEDDIENAKDSIRFPFNSDKCTDFKVIKHLMVTVCLLDQVRQMIVTNLVDLSQTYIPLGWVSIYPNVTNIKISRSFGNISFLQYNTFRTNEMNMVEITKTYFFQLTNFINIQAGIKDCVSPFFVATLQFNGIENEVTDTAIGSNFLTDKGVYRVSWLDIRLRNYAYFQLIEEAYYIFNGNNRWIKRGVLVNNSMIFSINTSLDMKKLVLNGARIKEIIIDRADYEAKNESLFLRYNLLIFPNYHSYLIRNRNLTRNETSFYRLFNPFAELENEYTKLKSFCFGWACAQVTKFGEMYFIRVYDMMFERMKSNLSSNLEDNFGRKVNIFVDDYEGARELPIYLLDNIQNKYTIFPIEIYNETDLEIIEFDKNYRNPKQPEQLRLVILKRPNLIKIVKVNRKLSLSVNNLYFSSRRVEIVMRRAYGSSTRLKISFINFKENDYYKYFIHILIIVIITCLFLIVYMIRLKKAQRINMEQVLKNRDGRSKTQGFIEEVKFAEENETLALSFELENGDVSFMDPEEE